MSVPKNTTNVPKVTKDNGMLIDIQYIKANKKAGQPDDYLYIIWKDLDTLEKNLTIITNPGVEIYFEKPEARTHMNCHTYARLEDTVPQMVKYSDIIYAIANDAGPSGQSKLDDCFRTRNFEALQDLHLYPYVFGADLDVRSMYRYYWMKSLNNARPKPITKGFMDIEVDLSNATGFPQAEVDPIDLVTVIDASQHMSYTFCLIGILSHKSEEDRILSEKRSEIQHYYAEHPDALIEEAHKMFDENYPDMDYKFFFYEDEPKMLIHIFQLINSLRLDFMLIWNISFDIPYIIDRLKVLGLDPAQVMADPDFPVKECYFKKDKHHFAIKEQSDFFHISAYTVYACQMRMYAAIRKGQSELRNNTLNYIAEREINDSKLNYESEKNLRRLSLLDWLKYVLYNIKDVLLQQGIDDRTQDLATYYFRSYKNMTPYEDEFKQTAVLRNVQYKSFLEQGIVPGENINRIIYRNTPETEGIEDSDEPSFEGALVGNPLLNGYFGVRMYGKTTNNVFKYSVDFDMSAFYPSTIQAMNIDPTTLIFKMILMAEQFDVRGGQLHYNGITDVERIKTKSSTKKNDDPFSGDIGKEVMDNFQTRHYLTFGNKWLNLPSVGMMESLLQKRFNS